MELTLSFLPGFDVKLTRVQALDNFVERDRQLIELVFPSRDFSLLSNVSLPLSPDFGFPDLKGAWMNLKEEQKESNAH